MAHTLGPWGAGTYRGTPTVFWSAGNGTVAIATVHDIASSGDSVTNAKLIAAAPDLLEACKQALALIGTDDESASGCGSPVEVADDLRQAIKKARGE